MVDQLRTTDAQLTHKIVTLKVRSNLANNYATDVSHVQVDNNLLEIFARPQDQSVLATKNTTHRLTDVTIAQQVNFQVTPTMV
jgi:hypothetical protein